MNCELESSQDFRFYRVKVLHRGPQVSLLGDGANLNSVVRRLVPRRESFEKAVSLFRSGEFSSCLAALTHYEGPEAAALHARCLIRSGQASDAFEYLAAVDTRNLGHRAAAEILIVKVGAAIADVDSRRVEPAILEAKARSYGVGSVELASELRYYEALRCWITGQHDVARKLAESALVVDASIPEWLREHVPSYPFSQGYWRARLFELLGLIDGSELDFEAQAAHLLEAFDEYDRADCIDACVEAGMLGNLAVIVRELQDSSLADYVRARAACMRWSDALAPYHFRVIEALAWCNALSGDHLGSFRDFRVSAEIAPTKPLKILAILNRVFLARELGETFFATEELDYASRLAAEVDWENCFGDDRFALLMLAQAVAPLDSARARSLLNRYLTLKMGVSPLFVQSHDRRMRGYECMAIGAVARAEGHESRATMLFTEAFEIWTEVGYSWRGAVAALELYALTADSKFLEAVRREAVVRPFSWVAKRFASASEELAAPFSAELATV